MYKHKAKICVHYEYIYSELSQVNKHNIFIFHYSKHKTIV